MFLYSSAKDVSLYLQSKGRKNFLNKQFFPLLNSINLKFVFNIEDIFLQCTTLLLVHLV